MPYCRFHPQMMMDDLARLMPSLYTSCCHMLRFIDTRSSSRRFLQQKFAQTHALYASESPFLCKNAYQQRPIFIYRIPKYFVTLAISQLMSWVSMFSASKIVVKNFSCSQRLVYDVGLSSVTKIQFDCIRKRVHFACVSTG